MAKTYQWTNDTPLGFINDELDALWADRQVWIPSQAMTFDTAATNPAYRVFSIGSSRLGAILVPAGSTNIYLWSNFYRPAKWQVGDKIKTTIVYGLDTAGVALDVVTFVTSGFGYDVGDAYTSPTVNWNETLNADVSSHAISSMYEAEISEATSTVANNILSFRLNLKRSDAAYTYGGAVHIFGALLEVI